MNKEEAQKEHEAIKAEYEVDLNDLPKQEHFWVDRGVVMSCEGAGHPNHRTFKRVK